MPPVGGGPANKCPANKCIVPDRPTHPHNATDPAPQGQWNWLERPHDNRRRGRALVVVLTSQPDPVEVVRRAAVSSCSNNSWMNPRTRSRMPTSIGSNQASPENNALPVPSFVVLCSSMAWSPPACQRRLWLVEQTGDYATSRFHHFRDATLG